MRITDLLKKESIELNSPVSTKQGAIDKLIDLQAKAGNISDKNAYKKDILAREQMSSTAVGDGIAIPHAKSEAVRQPGLAAITAPNGVDYESMDGKPSNILFMIAAPNDGDLHLEVLSKQGVALSFLFSRGIDGSARTLFLLPICAKDHRSG